MLNTCRPSNLPGKAAVSTLPKWRNWDSEMLRKLPAATQPHEVKTAGFKLGFVWLQNVYSFHNDTAEEKRKVSSCLSTIISISPYLSAFFSSLSLGLFLFFRDKTGPLQNYKDWPKCQIRRLFRDPCTVLGASFLLSRSQLSHLHSYFLINIWLPVYSEKH